MMDITTIGKLIDAGYTKQEIEAMNAPEPVSAPDPEPDEPVKDPEPEQKPAAPALGPDDVTTDQQIKSLQETLNKFIYKLQKMNVMNDDSSGKTTVKTDEEIIAKLIGG